MRGSGFGVGVFLVFWLIFFVLGVAATVFWVVKLVEVLRIPEAQYRGAGTDKVTWGLVVGLLGWLGALIWQLAKRAEVLSATPVPTYSAQPGWYPDPRTGQLVWFDGVRWVGPPGPQWGSGPSGTGSGPVSGAPPPS